MISHQRLDAVCDIAMGQAPSGDAYNYEGEGWPLIAGAGDFGDLYPVVKKYTTTAARLSKHGDIVLGIRASIGEKVMSDGEYCLGRGVAGLRAKPNLAPRYLWHWLTHVGPRLASKAKGATFKQVNKDDIGELEMALPPLPEQRRIAAILDQADALRAKRREALALLDSLTQSIFIDMFGDARSTVKFPLGGIRAFVEANSGKSAKSVLSEAKTEIPIYGGNGINGWATKALYEQPVVVFGRVGQQCGNVCITDGPSWVTDNAIVVRILESTKLNADYLLHAFGQSDFSNRVKHLDLPFINQGMILDNPIPMPPVSLQHTFATRIQSVETLKGTHKAALQELDRLFASLQHRAFQGEL